MLYVLLWIYAIADRVHSEELASPQDVHVNNSLLMWTPAHQHNHVTYTVQYQSTKSDTWKDVQSCVETALTSCDVTSTEKAAKYGCVQLRVLARTHNLTSTPVEACSRLGDSCSPSVGLHTQPGILFVTLSRDHRLITDRALAKYRVYYGLEGQPLEEYEYLSKSSVSIEGLEEGKSYCVYVQIVIDSHKTEYMIGPPSCPKCVVIQESGEKLKQVKIIASVISVIIAVFLLIFMTHVLLHQKKRIDRIKQWFKPEPMPPSLRPFQEHQRPLIIITPQEEQCDRISFTFTHEEQGLTSVQET